MDLGLMMKADIWLKGSIWGDHVLEGDMMKSEVEVGCKNLCNAAWSLDNGFEGKIW